MPLTTRGRLRIEQVDVKKLVPWENNPRTNDQAVNPVANSIKQFGFNVPILCNKGYRIIAGHTRWKAAKKLGLRTVPVVQLNLSDKEQAAFAIVENKTGELADWSTSKLKEILNELHSEDGNLRVLGFTSAELRRLLGAEVVRENAIPEPTNVTRTAPNTLWKLGRHRLFCGDSRHKKTWTHLLGDTKVDHVFAGPPYFNQRAYSHWDDYSAYLQDMDAVMAQCRAAMKKGAVLAWNIGNGSSTHHAHVIHHGGLLEENGFCFLDMIAWVKPGANYSIPRHANIKRHRHYYPSHQWEALLVYQKLGTMAEMRPEAVIYLSSHPTDVWEVPPVQDQQRKFGHPAICPVELPYRTIEAYVPAEGCVLDPFGGSGTTLLAAERTGRRAFLIENNPCYCDIILRRWENFTGNRARRINRLISAGVLP